jgi:ammonia channel protein AmtB
MELTTADLKLAIDTVWTLLAGCLVFWMGTGFAMLEAGLARAKHTTNVLASHIFGFITVGVFTHLNKFIQIGTLVKSLRKGPIAIFTAIVEILVGIIETVGELAKVLSLSLRLFGNVFANVLRHKCDCLCANIGAQLQPSFPT